VNITVYEFLFFLTYNHYTKYLNEIPSLSDLNYTAVEPISLDVFEIIEGGSLIRVWGNHLGVSDKAPRWILLWETLNLSEPTIGPGIARKLHIPLRDIRSPVKLVLHIQLHCFSLYL